MNKETKDKRRHIRFWRFFRPLLIPFLKWRFNYNFDIFDEDGENYIVLSNHNTDYDPILVGFSFPQQMYFVASEQIFRKGLATKFLRRYLAPIARIKGSTAASTVMEMKRSLKDGNNICVFPEGNCSYNGKTCEIMPVIGKLVKSSKVKLVTYKLTGGYFTKPRWGYTLRRGKMSGNVVNVYTPEQLEEMTVDEINIAIENDLYEDAYERQKEERIKFAGKRLAEGIECAIYMCPKCKEISKIHSKGNAFTCDCGLEIQYDEYGMLHGAEFSTITEWDEWQKKALNMLFKEKSEDDVIIFEDEEISLYCVSASHQSELIYSGKIQLSTRSLMFGETEFEIKNILAMSIFKRNSLVFTSNNIHYEVKSGHEFCARKYLEIYENFLKG